MTNVYVSFWGNFVENVENRDILVFYRYLLRLGHPPWNRVNFGQTRNCASTYALEFHFVRSYTPAFHLQCEMYSLFLSISMHLPLVFFFLFYSCLLGTTFLLSLSASVVVHHFQHTNTRMARKRVHHSCYHVISWQIRIQGTPGPLGG